MLVDGKNIQTYTIYLLCILLNTTQEHIQYFVEEYGTKIQIYGYEYASWLDKRVHLNIVAYKSNAHNNAEEEMILKNLRETYDDMLYIINNVPSQGLCLKYIDSSKIFSQDVAKKPFDAFIDSCPTNQAPLITYVNKNNVRHYKAVKNIDKKLRDPSHNDERKDITFVTLELEKMQPNKEGSSKSIITATIYGGILEISYHHLLIMDQVSVIQQLEQCIKLSPQEFYSEKNIRYVIICPGNLVRCDVLMSICMNHDKLSKYLCVNEREIYHTSEECKLIAMIGDKKTYTIRVKNKIVDSLTLCKKFGIDYLSQCVTFVATGIPSITDADIIGVLIESVMLEYLSKEASIQMLYDKYLPEVDKYQSVKPVKLTRMKLLRGQSMELFAQRYSRECPVVPSVIHEKFLDKYIAMGRNILRYPKTGPHSRYYMAPKGYYVGLKLNRLKNSNLFPFIVSCYVRNHAEDPNSHTFRYIHDLPMRKCDIGATYINKVKKLKAWQRGIIPQYISNLLTGEESSYIVRVGLPDRPIDFITSLLNPNEVLVPQLALQEMYDYTFEEIQKLLCECSNYDCLFNMYRVLEEALQADIFIIHEVNKEASIKLPRHKDIYMWRKKYNKMLLIAHTRINEYETVYEIICKRCSDIYIYPESRIYKEITSMKENMLNKTYEITKGILSMYEVESLEDSITLQYINSRGKTVLVEIDNKLVECYTRPLACPFVIIGLQRSVLKDYIDSVKDVNSVNRLYYETFIQSSKYIVLHGSNYTETWKTF